MLKKILFGLIIFTVSPCCFALSNILILGDSLSAGYGFEKSKNWTVLLQQRLDSQHLPYHVINASISGNTTSNGLDYLPRALKDYKPKIVIIALGANDGLRGIKLKETKRNLIKMIQLSQLASSKVLVAGLRLPPNYGADYTQRFQAMYTDLAKKYHVQLIPLLLHRVDDRPELMQADTFHPNAQAQTIILENVWEVLQKNLQ